MALLPSHNGSVQRKLLLPVFFSTGEWAVHWLWAFNWFNSWRGGGGGSDKGNKDMWKVWVTGILNVWHLMLIIYQWQTDQRYCQWFAFISINSDGESVSSTWCELEWWSGGTAEMFLFHLLKNKTFCKLYLHLLKEYMCVYVCVFTIVTVDADKCLLLLCQMKQEQSLWATLRPVSPWRFQLMEIQCWFRLLVLRDSLGIKNVIHWTH